MNSLEIWYGLVIFFMDQMIFKWSDKQYVFV